MAKFASSGPVAIQGYAHCVNLRGKCPGYAQELVPALREEISHAFIGAPGNAVENTMIHVSFANDDADAPCPHCGARREVSSQPRPEYQEFVPGEVAPAAPVAANAELAALRAEVDALKAAQVERRGPGRPPKVKPETSVAA